MKKITKEQVIINHRKMWCWIAEWTRLLKRKVRRIEYFDDIPVREYPRYGCYCCEFVYQFFNDDDCSLCPIEWGKGRKCEEYGTLFNEWINCNDSNWERAAELADMIAELPERKDIEENIKENNEKTEENKKTEADKL